MADRGFFDKPSGVGDGITPTPVRGTGTTERLASHRADDTAIYDGPSEFERSTVNHPTQGWKGSQRLMKRSKRSVR